MELKFSPTFRIAYLLVAFPSISAFAITNTTHFDGLSYGAGAGVDTFMGSLRNSTTVGPINTSTHDNVYQYGLMGNVFVGIGKVYPSNFYFGTDLGLNIYGTDKLAIRSSSNATYAFTDALESRTIPDGFVANQAAQTTTLTRHPYEPVLDFKPGYLVTPSTLIYGLLGFNYNQYRLKTDVNGSASGALVSLISTFDSRASATSGFSTSHSASVFGTRLGVGVDQLVTSNLSVGASYVYTFYRSISNGGSALGNGVVCDGFEGCNVNRVGSYTDGNARVSDQQLMMSLIYHVC